jgi:hypothetical protein
MSTGEYRRKLEELDRLLNDPDVPMQPDRIWSLLADVSLPEVTLKIQPPVASAADQLGFNTVSGAGLACKNIRPI